MLRLSLGSLLGSLLFVVACGGDNGTSDTGSTRMDAPAVGEDAPASESDAPGLDAPATGEDAFSAEDAPSAADDAPGTEDAARPGDDALSSQDAPSADAPATGAFCGGIAGITCLSRAEYCNYDCTVPDGAGTCEVRPDICTREIDPVCGCDGMTYGNPCMAAAAGQPVRSRGACPGVSDCRTDGCADPGQECCTGGRSAGRCYDPRCLSCCM